MRQKSTKKLYAYWNEVRAGQPAPKRFDIEPVKLASILPETFILEYTPESTYRFRLAGTKLCEIFAEELRGMSLADLFDVTNETSIQALVDTTRTRAAAINLLVEATSEMGRHVDLEILILPLRLSGDRIDRFLGCMSPSGSPEWLGADPLVGLTIIEQETVAYHEKVLPEAQPNANQRPLRESQAGGRIVHVEKRTFRVIDGGRPATRPPLDRAQ
jgi:hypothetical protein